VFCQFKNEKNQGGGGAPMTHTKKIGAKDYQCFFLNFIDSKNIVDQ
ncbi:MAG: hypothetical protein ACI8RD_007724, partial [Bacillariaceae sp.]|jgi:hypothetical protein